MQNNEAVLGQFLSVDKLMDLLKIFFLQQFSLRT